MALGGSACHPDLQGRKGKTALEHQQGHRWQSRPWAAVWPLGATRATDINTAPGYGRTTNSDVVLGSSLGPEITMAPGGKQATHFSLLLTLLTSSVSPLSTAQLCFSFSTISPPSSCSSLMAPGGCLPPPRAKRRWADLSCSSFNSASLLHPCL